MQHGIPAFRALERAIEQATQERHAQARHHAQVQKTLQCAHGQLHQLQSYAQDTDARWIGGHTVNLSAALIRHHYQFMSRLQHAVTQQQGVIANLERQLGSARQVWLQAEYRLAGFKQVLKDRHATRAQVQERREQRATDECGALSHLRGRVARTTEDLV
jgi:flagellar protein FliJ